MSGRLGPAITVLAVLVVVAKRIDTNGRTEQFCSKSVSRDLRLGENARGANVGLDGRRRIDPDGTSVWVFERCGTFALPSERKPGSLSPVMGRISGAHPEIRCFGQARCQLRGRDVRLPARDLRGRDGNVWVPTRQGRDGKGHQVFKFGPDGQVLLTLGKAGVAGDAPDSSMRRRRFWSRPMAISSSPTDTAATPTRASSSSRRTANSSRPGAGRDRRPASSTRRTRIAMDSRDGCLSATAEQSHPDLRPGRQFHRAAGRNSAGRAASSSRATRSMSPIPNSESVSKNHDGWKRGIRIGKRRRTAGSLHSRPGGKGDEQQRRRGRRGRANGQHLWRGSRPDTADKVCEKLNAPPAAATPRRSRDRPVAWKQVIPPVCRHLHVGKLHRRQRWHWRCEDH